VSPLVRPRGLDGIIATFGDPYAVMGADGLLSSEEALAWEARLTSVEFHRPIRLSYGRAGQMATRMRCHQLVAGFFRSVWRAIAADDQLDRQVSTYGGAYLFRPKREASDELSTHSWGIAIDLNVATNKQGTRGDMHPGLVQVFEAHGFVWGGRWRRPDPMHFQFAEGY
jgi:D-alanyl-D-alanine carboxypeptidase-like protein